jgi:hypothetical protein
LGVVGGVALHFGVAMPKAVGSAAGALALLILVLQGSGKERRTR